MKYCPKCKSSFENEIKICPDCNMELVSKLDAEPADNQKWVSLSKMNSSIMADMLKEILEENNIVCLEKNDMFHSALGLEATAMAGGETEIFVPDEMLAKAKNILEQLNSKIAE